MRFTIATALLANSVAAVSSSKISAKSVSPGEADPVGNNSNNNNKDGQHRDTLRAKRRSLRQHNGEMIFRLLEGSILKTTTNGRRLLNADRTTSSTGLLTTTNVLDGVNGRTTELEVECDPNAAADVGVLSCGNEKYCVESEESSLGGVCADNDINNDHNTDGRPADDIVEAFGPRRLQLIGNLTVLELAAVLCNSTQFEYYSCECELDYAASVGTFSCFSNERCSFLESGCTTNAESFQYCISGSISGSLEGFSTYAYKTCYKQNMPDSNYVFEYCTDFTFDATNGAKCEIEVDGVKCNSCDIAIAGGKDYSENCEVFDCENTVINYIGDRCGTFANPTLLIESELNYLYEEHWPCEGGCNLCGYGGHMTNGKNSFNYTPQRLATATTFVCYDIMYGAMVGGLAETSYCESLPSVASEPCGCVSPSTILPGEGPVSQPSVPPASAPVAGAEPGSAQPPTASAGGSGLSWATAATIIQFVGMMIATWDAIIR